MTHHLRRLCTIAVAIAELAVVSTAAAQHSKEICIDAHSRGQDAREQGKIALARKLFLSCAQASCPAAVQSDCARFADDLMTLQPTVVLVARDGRGNDLPNTAVYIDGVRVATAIDGKPIDVDPGKHVLRFVHAGRDEIVTVIIGSGEKGRRVGARFGGGEPRSDAFGRSRHREAPARTTHPTGSLALAITGSVIAVAGGAIAFYGRSRLPSACTLSTHECAAPPGDPVFAEARDAAKTINVGILTGGAGVAVLAGGLVWYFAGSTTQRERPGHALAPWLRGDGGGVTVTGNF